LCSWGAAWGTRGAPGAPHVARRLDVDQRLIRNNSFRSAMTDTAKPAPRPVFDLLPLVKKSVVYLGKPVGDDPNWFATGFLTVTGGTNQLVTAKHAVLDSLRDRHDAGVVAYYNTLDGRLAGRRVSQVQEQGFNWVFHPDPGVDLAAIPIPLQLEGQDDVGLVPDEVHIKLADLEETWDVIYPTFQPGTQDVGNVAPVLRSGMISRKNSDGTYLIDGQAFPGNSGSPVFVKPQGMRITKKGALFGGDPFALRFAGIIGAYIPYEDRAVSVQTGQTRVVFQENTGLSLVWSSDRLRELFDCPEFSAQLKRASSYKPPTEEHSMSA
jgi:hypothetical protein